MSDCNFLDVYLREIGVQTPVSLVYSEYHKHPEATSLKPTEKISTADPYENLEDMALQATQCQACKLSESRKHIVFGQGNAHTDILFITDPPSKNEDQQGKCMVAQDAMLFDAMLTAISLKRQDVYTLNIIQCSTANHRDPSIDTLASCRPWLDKKIDLISPKVICVMGRIAAQYLLESDVTLHALRGQWHDYRGIPVRVSYPPTYLLRSPKNKQQVWQDLLLIQKRLNA